MNLSFVDTVSIPVADQSKALKFYRDALGFILLRDVSQHKDRWVQLVPQGGQTTISLVKPFASMQPGCVQGLMVKTDDIQRTCDALCQRGVNVSEICATIGGRFATFNDPDGNGWVIVEAQQVMSA
ncbi:VOC family protein [Thaumasiovibrio subtropicus]|uniref:VOC family protein n=1 Tax=Thaumasiovibrio subtropicus TaxID=1891207 RepID=UPI000B34D089|nr:VOC family protein [Thaumasiovibrio subtropicus]